MTSKYAHKYTNNFWYGDFLNPYEGNKWTSAIIHQWNVQARHLKSKNTEHINLLSKRDQNH